MSRSAHAPRFLLGTLALAAGLLCLWYASRPSGFPDAEWIGEVPEGNRRAPLLPRAVRRIVLFTTEHDVANSIRLWQSPASEASGHYIVGADGRVVQMVKDADVAYYAGNRSYNDDGIGIALEGYADPSAPGNKRLPHGWQTEAQRAACARLLKWLSGQYAIPLDRAHIVGKNQVPGVTAPGMAGPESWGGGTNKFAPGAAWNWTELMARLGRREKVFVVEAISDATVASLPAGNAPAITRLWRGDKAVCYDAHDDYYLVYVVGVEAAQPRLPAGAYHWDGWLAKRDVRVVTDSSAGRMGGVFPGLRPVYAEPQAAGRAAPLFGIPEGKWVVFTGSTQLDEQGTRYAEIFLQHPARSTRGWIVDTR